MSETKVTNEYRDVLDGAGVAPAVKPSEVHQGEITSIGKKDDYDSGAVAIIIGVRSLNTGEELSQAIFVPRKWVEILNNGVTAQEFDQDPGYFAQLPEAEGNKQQTSYLMGIKTSEGTAKMQILRTLAKEQGQTVPQQPESGFDAYVSFNAQFIVGTRCLFTREPDTKAADPAFRHFLRVQRFYPPLEDETAWAKGRLDKVFKRAKYVRVFEQ